MTVEVHLGVLSVSVTKGVGVQTGFLCFFLIFHFFVRVTNLTIMFVEPLSAVGTRRMMSMSFGLKGQSILEPMFCKISKQFSSLVMGMPRISTLLLLEYCSSWCTCFRSVSFATFRAAFSARI